MAGRRTQAVSTALRFGNLFDALPAATREEHVDVLLQRPGARLERIVSTGQTTPPGSWLDQEPTEWVVLLSGGARLRFAEEDADRILRPGDHVLIPSGVRHRVTWTDPDTSTVWLALHIEAPETGGEPVRPRSESGGGS